MPLGSPFASISALTTISSPSCEPNSLNARHRLFVDTDAIALIAFPPLGERRILLDPLLHDALRLGKSFAQIRQGRVEDRVLRYEIDEPGSVANAGTCDL